MRAVTFSALVASLAMAPMPVSATTYEEAAASGVSPVTGSEMLDCGFYWDAWARSLNPNYYREGVGIWDGKWVATLNPAIQLPAAAQTAQYWFDRAKAQYKREKNAPGYEDRMANAPDYDVEALDERKFMQFLGECARPAS